MRIKTVEDFYEYCANMGAQFCVTHAAIENPGDGSEDRLLYVYFYKWDHAEYFIQNRHE